MNERVNYLINLLATRIKDIRLKKNITQQELADMSGLSLNAIKGAERGECQLKTFVSILIPLGIDELIENMLPEQLPSPVDMTLRSRKKLRARKKDKPEDEDLNW